MLDSLARPTTAALPDGPVTVQAAYHPTGRLQSITNPYASTSDPTYGLDTYSYDGLSRLTASTTPESGATNLYYTTSGGSLCAAAANALCRRTDARGITTTYAYDALNRLPSKFFPE